MLEANVNFRVVYFEELDQEQFCELHRKSFAPLMEKEQFDDSYLNPVFFKWKYNTPAGRGRIAIAEQNGKVIAANSIVPVRISRNNEQAIAWQSCDTVVDPAHRGKGYFFQCLQLLQYDVMEGNFFTGFPNDASVKGFIRSGWNKAAEATIFLNPFSLLTFRSGLKSVELKKENIPVNMATDESGFWKVLLDADYLEWRYVSHPYNKYRIIEEKDDNGRTAFMVYREAFVRNRELMLIMDHAGSYDSFRRMVKTVLSDAHSKGIRFCFYFTNRWGKVDMFRSGFIAVPRNLLARKLDLYIGQKGSGRVSSEKWLIQSGDYDLF